LFGRNDLADNVEKKVEPTLVTQGAIFLSTLVYHFDSFKFRLALKLP